MRILSREHFFDLLDKGHEEFRIKTITPGASKREISEDAPFDRDDPMSYVLVDIIFDKIEVFAKGDFSAHDIAEATQKYSGTAKPSLEQRFNKLQEMVVALAIKSGLSKTLTKLGLAESTNKTEATA